MALTVSSLDKAVHDRSAFDSSDAALDDFLRTKAAQHQARRVSRTFVLADDAEPSRILGYYSLSNSQVARESLGAAEAKKLPMHPIPAVLLARLAVHRRHQGKRYGHWLLMDAVKRCALVGQQSGVYALLVEAKNEAAERFYKRFGFRAVEGHAMALYLPLATTLHALRPL